VVTHALRMGEGRRRSRRSTGMAPRRRERACIAVSLPQSVVAVLSARGLDCCNLCGEESRKGGA
jgi:hypothetical protein